jgi:ABC-2 type transport system permease protein
MWNLTVRVIRQLLGDHRTIAMILLAPLVVMTFVYFLLSDTDYTPTIAVDAAAAPARLTAALEQQDAHIRDVPLAGLDPADYLKDHRDVDAVVTVTAAGARVDMLESSNKSAKAMAVIQAAAAVVNPAVQMAADYVFGSADESLFSSLGYVFLGFFAFFFVFVISGMALVRERSSGTLERLLMTPLRRGEAIFGYTAGYGLFAIVQATAIVLYAIFVLGLPCVGQPAWVVLTMLLLAVAAVSFGALISIFSRSEFQVVQFIPVVIIPQVFFSGLIPLDTIPFHLGNLCYLFPIYYGCAAIKQIMIYGAGGAAIWPYLLALVGYTVVLSALNTATLKRYRRL